MGTRISVDVAQALLSQRVSALAAVNREKRLEREQGERDKAKIQGAIERGVDGAAGSGGGSGGLGGPSANGRNRASQAASASPLADLDAQLRAGTLRSGVPEYYTGPKVAATPRGGKSWLLVPSDAEFRAKVRGLPPFAFSNAEPFLFQFDASGGPAGRGAAYMATAPVFADGDRTCSYALQATGGTGKEPLSRSLTFEALLRLMPAIAGSPYFQSSIQVAIPGVVGLSIGHLWDQVDETTYTPYRVLNIDYGAASYSATNIEIPGVTADVIASVADPAVWHHVAVVQQPGSSPTTRNVSRYYNGQRVAYSPEVSAELLPAWDTPSSPNPAARLLGVYADIGFAFDDTGSAPTISQPSKAHGFRFTPRALYTGNTYTPPTSITSLA